MEKLSRFRLFSANVWNGEADPAALADLLLDEEIDVAVFQEITPAQAEAVVSVLPHGEIFPDDDHHGMGIATRSAVHLRRIPLHFRDALATDLELSRGKMVHLVNVHLAAPHDGLPWTTLPRRKVQLSGIMRYLEKRRDDAMVVAGDFNATPMWPAYRHLRELLEDAAELYADEHGRKPRRTWGPWPGSLRLLRIDHVFVRGMRVLDFRVVPVAGGDHSGLIADLEPLR